MTEINTIARVCHEANRAFQVGSEEAEVNPPWDEAPDWMVEVVHQGVHKVLAGRTPQQLHDDWSRYMWEQGWRYGEVKDAVRQTHPSLVPYDMLPESQRAKDLLFHAIVRALT